MQARTAILVLGVFTAACFDADPTAVTHQDNSPAIGAVAETHGAEAYDARVPIAWLRLSFDLTRDEFIVPPVAARVYGYAGVTLWEAVSPGVLGGRSLAGQLNGLVAAPRPFDDLHWPTVANAALAGIMSRFYTSQSSRRAIRALEQDLREEFRREIPPGLLGRSAAYGHRVATAVWRWSRGDGYDELSDCPYTPPAGPGLWAPTPPDFEPPVQPCWGHLRPLVLSGAEACAAGSHPPYSEDPASQFYQEALEVYRTVNELTPEQRTIALYWADLAGESATPAGHSLSITAQVLEQLDASLDIAAETISRVSIGESDAFIACWATKYHYSLLRPVTYINRLIDARWTPVLETPPFPAYTSGHSNDAGVSSTILGHMFGEELGFTDHTNDERGFAPRSFDSFQEAAQESAFSRLYGGIHYRADIERGFDQGRCVARAVMALVFRTGALSRR